MQFPALAFSMYTANFARVEKLRFSPAFLYTRFNFFYVKYHASAACHGEINFSKLPSTQFAREKLPRLKQCKNSVEEEIKTVKDRGNGDIIFVVLITYLPFVRKASTSGLTVKYHKLRDRSVRLSSPAILFEFMRDH